MFWARDFLRSKGRIRSPDFKNARNNTLHTSALPLLHAANISRWYIDRLATRSCSQREDAVHQPRVSSRMHRTSKARAVYLRGSARARDSRQAGDRLVTNAGQVAPYLDSLPCGISGRNGRFFVVRSGHQSLSPAAAQANSTCRARRDRCSARRRQLQLYRFDPLKMA